MAMWSKALPLTASCLSPLFGIKSQSGACEKLKVASDLGLGTVFCTGTPVSSTSYNYGRKSYEVQNFKNNK